MIVVHNEFIIYGLEEYKNIIYQIEMELDLQGSFFDIQLMLTEGITNAYQHGNQGDSSKAIKIMYELNNTNLHLEIQDCGDGVDQVRIPQCIAEDSILDQNGRGLFLIRCISDKVDFCNNRLIIEKNLNKE